MSFETLDENISHLIDQYQRESEETLKSFDLDSNVSDCLSSLIAKNVEVLNNIRMEVSDFLSKK